MKYQTRTHDPERSFRHHAWSFRPVGILLLLSTLTFARAAFIEVDNGGIFSPTRYNGGASWGDYDGDGDQDLFVTLRNNGMNVLYRNIGGGMFDQPGLGEIGELAAENMVAVQAIWADIDNDGDLDLYVANRATVPVAGGSPVPDRLYLNDGNGSFTRTAIAGTDGAGVWPNSGSLVDFDNDGDLDVFEPTFHGSGLYPEVLFRNDGGLQFSRVVLEGAPSSYAISGAWADFDGDGDLDVVVANQAGPSFLFRNQLRETGSADFVVVGNGPEARGIHFTQSGCATWGDLDNDGDLDLITTNDGLGFQIHRRTEDSHYEPLQFHDLGGRGVRMVALIDAENDGDLDIIADMVGGSYGYSLFVNQGDGATFIEEFLATARQFAAVQNAPAVGDFNNDGYADVFIAYEGLPGALFENEGGDNHWLKLVLKGTSSNGSGIGAIVRVRATIRGQQVWQMRQVSAGGEAWRVQHDLRPNFGLGDATVAEVVRIEWPSGTVQELTEVAADQILPVIEPPTLSVEAAVILSWPVTAESYDLFGAESLAGPWMEIDTAVTVEQGRSTAIVKASERMRFYELRQL